MPTRPPYFAGFALAAAASLLGIGVGACLTPGLGAVSLLVAVTGAVLVLAFRVYEGRATVQEQRIAVLEEHRHAIESLNDRLESLSGGIARVMASVLETTPCAEVSSHRVPVLTVALGKERGLDADALAVLRTAALLHDVGRLNLAENSWSRPGPLSPEEWEAIRRLPEQGADFLRTMDVPRAVEEIVRAHQERWDGNGYPAGLRGPAIPLGARILAVADAYDAITSVRPWRPPRNHRDAMETLCREAGHAFDPAVVAAFERIAARGDFMEIAGPKRQQPDEPSRSAGLIGADERI